ncbi:hypothetical protein GCM10009848_12250 [Micromonospora lupini]
MATEASGYEHKLAIFPEVSVAALAVSETGSAVDSHRRKGVRRRGQVARLEGKADRVEKYSLDAQAREHLERALAGSAGRSAATVYGGHEHTLRQTIVALRAGTELSDHENPGEATVLVLRGRVELIDATTSWTGRQGDLLIVPQRRHRLSAHEDSVVLLTVAKVAPAPADVQ